MAGVPDIPYSRDTTEASLLAHTAGWYLVLISANGRESVFVSRDDVGDVIGDHRLDHRPAVLGHFEETLRAARYEPVRMAPEPGAMAAWWLSPGGP